MQSLLAKLATFAVLVGGFAVTGDLRRLADRGSGLLNATSVPTGQAPPSAAPPSIRPTPSVAPVPATPERHSPPGIPADAPVGRPVDTLRLPISTLETLDLATLAPGGRFTVWAGSPPAPVTFDVVDPASGEVLEQSLPHAGDAPHAISRRLRLEGEGPRPRLIVRGAWLRLVPLGIAHGGRPSGPAEMLGPVRAIEVKNDRPL